MYPKRQNSLSGVFPLFEKKSLKPRFQGSIYVREKIRTPDTLVRSQVLYPAELRTHILFSVFTLMPATGIEPVLYFYNRILSPARLPVPPRRHIYKWDLQGSNLWPSACKADALPAELRSHAFLVVSVLKTYLRFDKLACSHYERPKRDSNPRPPPWQGGALTNWAIGPYSFLMDHRGLEPRTDRLWAGCSNQLS